MTVRTISNSIDLNPRQAQIQTFSASSLTYANFQGSAYPALDIVTGINPIQPNDYSSVWVGGAGKNKYNVADGLVGIYSSGGKVTSSSNAYSFIVPCKPNTQYTVSKTAGVRFQLYYTYEYPNVGVNTYGLIANNTASSITITTDANATYLCGYVWYATSDSITKDQMEQSIQVELGATATSWTPYENVCPISGSTEVNTYVNSTYNTVGADKYTTPLNQTVYSATLNVTTGTLTVNNGYKLLTGDSSESYIYMSNYDGFRITLSDANINGVPRDQLLSNRFTGASARGIGTESGALLKTYSSTSDNTYVFLCGTGCTTESDFKTWLASNNTQLVYPLATPQTYHLTPQQVMLLQGTNNVWTDTGGIDIQYAIITEATLEALRKPIANAAKTATSYITAIDEGGIKVHDAGDADNYTKINSNGMQVYQDEIEVASFGSTTRIGPQADSNKVEIEDDRMRMIAYTGVPALDISIPEDGEVVPSYSETISSYREMYGYIAYNDAWDPHYCTEEISVAIGSSGSSAIANISDANLQQVVSELSSGDIFMLTLEVSYVDGILIPMTGVGKTSLNVQFTKGTDSTQSCSYSQGSSALGSTTFTAQVTYHSDTNIFDIKLSMERNGWFGSTRKAYLDIYSITTIQENLKNYMYMNGDLIACAFKGTGGSQFSQGDFGALGQNILFHINQNDALYAAINKQEWNDSVFARIAAYEPNNGEIDSWAAYIGTDITTIKAITIPSDKIATWSSSDTSIATIEVNSFDTHQVTITPVSTGTCYINLSMTVLGRKYTSSFLLTILPTS